MLSSIYVSQHGLPKRGCLALCFGKLCRHPEPCSVELHCFIGPNKWPFKCLWPPVCLHVLAILCTYILVLVFTSFSRLYVYSCAAVYVSQRLSNATVPLLSLSTLFHFAVRINRRTTRDSVSRCGSNAPRSWGSRLWHPAARPSITSWTLTTAGRQGQGGRSKTM